MTENTKPTTYPWNDTRSFIRKKLFPYDWSKSEQLYKEYMTLLKMKENIYEYNDKILKEEWHINLPPFPNFSINASFSNPSAAEADLSRTITRLKAYDPLKIKMDISKGLSISFIKDLQAKAPKNGLLLFKNNYQPYYEENIRDFENAVKNREPAILSMLGLSAMWAIVTPECDVENHVPTLYGFCPNDFKGYI